MAWRSWQGKRNATIEGTSWMMNAQRNAQRNEARAWTRRGRNDRGNETRGKGTRKANGLEGREGERKGAAGCAARSAQTQLQKELRRLLQGKKNKMKKRKSRFRLTQRGLHVVRRVLGNVPISTIGFKIKTIHHKHYRMLISSEKSITRFSR